MNATARTASLMATDMSEQPDVLRRLVDRREAVHETVRALAPVPFRGIALLGRGSSGHAALYARILLEVATAKPVTLMPPSMSRLYHPQTDMHGTLAIGLTQSGRTPDIAESLASLRSRGATTLGVTADTSAPLAGASDRLIDIGTDGERAVPATKTFTAELAVMAMVAEALGGRPWPRSAWDGVVAAVASALEDESAARTAALAIARAAHVSVIGAGLLVAIAEEGALKILETARIPATGWSSGAFPHGPMTLAGPSEPLVAIASRGGPAEDFARIRPRLRNHPIIVIADAPDADLPFDGGLPGALAAIPAAARAQQLALQAALVRGLDPDHPPGLTKVTWP
jgi:glutamine---fructose-6-phosphate transaminase (isomerizing)